MNAADTARTHADAARLGLTLTAGAPPHHRGAQRRHGP